MGGGAGGKTSEENATLESENWTLDKIEIVVHKAKELITKELLLQIAR